MIAVFNTAFLFNNKYAFTSGSVTFNDRLTAAEQIVKIANGRPYKLIGKGPGSQFDSFTTNYEYLAWWLCGNTGKKGVVTPIEITDTGKKINVTPLNGIQ